jgi:phosphatidylglycerophosphatase GEP4
MKPSYKCIASIRKYFNSLHTPVRDDELVIVGDRIFTDVVMANRMKRKPLTDGKTRDGPLAIWTTGVWEREGTVIRWLEKTLVKTVERWYK